jgi:hypothetical protein
VCVHCLSESWQLEAFAELLRVRESTRGAPAGDGGCVDWTGGLHCNVCMVCGVTAVWPATLAEVLRRAKQRGDEECAICMEAMAHDAREHLLLSCSHVFHEACIRSLEGFHLCEVCAYKYAYMYMYTNIV